MRDLNKIVEGEENGRPFKMPQFEAMISSLLADYPRATMAMKLRTLDWVGENLPAILEEREHVPSPQSVANLVERLREEYRRDRDTAEEHASGASRA